MSKRFKKLNTNSNEFNLIYRAYVIDNNDPLNEGRIKVYAEELGTQNYFWARPLKTSANGLTVPEVNSYVYILLDEENPSNVVYFPFEIVEFIGERIEEIVNDERTFIYPELQEFYYDPDKEKRQDRYVISFFTPYSSEYFYRIPNRLAYKDYENNVYYPSKENKHFEGKQLRIRQSLWRLESNPEVSNFSFYLLPGAGNEVYKPKLSKVFDKPAADKEVNYQTIVASHSKLHYKTTLKISDLDKKIPLLKDDQFTTLYDLQIESKKDFLERKSTTAVRFDSSTDNYSSEDKILQIDTNNYLKRKEIKFKKGSKEKDFAFTYTLTKDGIVFTQLEEDKDSNVFKSETRTLDKQALKESREYNFKGQSVLNQNLNLDNSGVDLKSLYTKSGAEILQETNLTSSTATEKNSVKIGSSNFDLQISVNNSTVTVSVSGKSGQSFSVTMDSSSGSITVNADSSVTVTTKNATVNANTTTVNTDTTTVNSNTTTINASSTTVNSPTISLNGNVTVTGTLGVSGLTTLSAGVTSSGSKVMTIDDFITTYDTHTHTGNDGRPTSAPLQQY